MRFHDADALIKRISQQLVKLAVINNTLARTAVRNVLLAVSFHEAALRCSFTRLCCPVVCLYRRLSGWIQSSRCSEFLWPAVRLKTQTLSAALITHLRHSPCSPAALKSLISSIFSINGIIPPFHTLSDKRVIRTHYLSRSLVFPLHLIISSHFPSIRNYLDLNLTNFRFFLTLFLEAQNWKRSAHLTQWRTYMCVIPPESTPLTLISPHICFLFSSSSV